MHTHMHTRTHILANTRTYIHTYIHKHTHTHTYTYTVTYNTHAFGVHIQCVYILHSYVYYTLYSSYGIVKVIFNNTALRCLGKFVSVGLTLNNINFNIQIATALING